MQLLCIEAGKYAQFSVHLSMYLFVQCKSKTNTNSFTHSQFMFHYAYTEKCWSWKAVHLRLHIAKVNKQEYPLSDYQQACNSLQKVQIRAGNN